MLCYAKATQSPSKHSYAFAHECSSGVVGPRHGTRVDSRTELESSAKEGDSPVSEINNSPSGILSTTEHLKFCGNLGGPSSKPKYSPATDSELVP